MRPIDCEQPHYMREEIKTLRARVAELERNQDELCDRRERVAMMIPVGQETGEVEDALECYIDRLKARADAAEAKLEVVGAEVEALRLNALDGIDSDNAFRMFSALDRIVDILEVTETTMVAAAIADKVTVAERDEARAEVERLRRDNTRLRSLSDDDQHGVVLGEFAELEAEVERLTADLASSEEKLEAVETRIGKFLDTYLAGDKSAIVTHFREELAAKCIAPAGEGGGEGTPAPAWTETPPTEPGHYVAMVKNVPGAKPLRVMAAFEVLPAHNGDLMAVDHRGLGWDLCDSDIYQWYPTPIRLPAGEGDER